MGGTYRQHRARAAAAASSAAGRLGSELNRPHGGTRQARVSDLELAEPRAGDGDRFGSDRPQAFCSACACAAALQVTAPNSVVRRRCVLRAEREPNADLARVNLAGILRDGDQIHVPELLATEEVILPDDLPTPSGGTIVYINTAPFCIGTQK